MPYFIVIRERSSGWNWSVPMRRQAEWEPHAAFLEALVADRFIVAGGPLGDEDTAARVMLVVNAPERDAVETCMAADPWTPMHLLNTVSIETWTVLLGGFREG